MGTNSEAKAITIYDMCRTDPLDSTGALRVGKGRPGKRTVPRAASSSRRAGVYCSPVPLLKFKRAENAPQSIPVSLRNQREAIMKTTKDHDERIAKLTFASVYPHYLAKVEKKGRTEEELHQIISWLTGFKKKDLQRLITNDATFEQFFREAKVNPNASLITGAICGYRIEEIETPLTKQVRYLDKLVDELAKGRKMEKILRTR